MRISVAAPPSTVCNASLSFADNNGTALGTGATVSVNPGTATSLDLNAATLGLAIGRRIEVQLVVTPVFLPGAVLVDSVSLGSVEVFDRFTGRTWSTQSTTASLPAVR
jgi:hypothetical protein